MISESKLVTHTPSAPKVTRRRFRTFLLFVVIAVILLMGGSIAWWFIPPALEPLPSVSTERMEPDVRNFFKAASTNVAMNSWSAAAWGELGGIYFGRDFEAPAQVCYRNAERLDPSDYRWPYFLGLSLVNTDRNESVAAYRRAAERCGERTHVRLRFVEMLLERGELEEAEAQLQKILASAPSNTRAQYVQARLLAAQGAFDEARNWAERSVKNAPDKRAPHLLLAQLCRRTHDVQGEARALAALAKIPDGFTPWEDPDIVALGALRQDRGTQLAKAEALGQRGDFEAAEEVLHEMAGIEGPSAAAKLARAFNRQGKNREAERLLRSQLRGFSADERLHFELAAACFQQEKYKDAEAEYLRVIELKPDYVDAWYNLGLARLKLGKLGDAREAFAATVRLHPSHVIARIKLAELLWGDGQREAAQEHLEAALKISPAEPQATELLTRVKAGAK